MEPDRCESAGELHDRRVSCGRHDWDARTTEWFHLSGTA